MNILILDDDRAMRVIMDTMITKVGAYTTLPCSNIADALSLIERHRIDGAFLDLVLRDGIGLQVAEACRNQGIPVVFCTSSHDIHNLNLMYEYGWVIEKPIQLSAVDRSIKYFKGAK